MFRKFAVIVVFALAFVALAIGASRMPLTLNIGSGPIALVQQGSVSPAGTVASIGVVTVTLPVPSTAGTALIVILANSSGGGPESISSGPTGFIRAIGGSQGAQSEFELWIYQNNPGGMSVFNFRASALAAQWYGHVSEWSNVQIAAYGWDSSLGTATAGTTLDLLTNDSSTVAGDLAISAWIQRLAAPAVVTFTTPTSWTRLTDTGATSASDHVDIEYQLNPPIRAQLGTTLTSTGTTTSAVGAIVILRRAPPLVDQTAYLAHDGLSLKLNTADFGLMLGGRYLLESSPSDGYLLEDGSGVLLLNALAPTLGDPVAFTNPAWGGRVVSVNKADIVDKLTNYQLASVVATNQTVAAVTIPPGDFSDVVTGGHYLLEDGSGAILLQDGTSTYSAAVLADLPVAYWRLNETSGNAVDASGNGHGALASTGITYQVTSAVDVGVTLDGAITTFYSVPTAPALHPGDTFSLEAWLRLTDVTSVPVIFDSGATADFQMYVDATGHIVLQKRDTSAIGTSTAAYNNGSWHHVVWTKAAATNHLYVDGVDVTPAITNATIVAGATALGLGRLAAFASNQLTGSLDEVAIYNTALSATRVAAHYAAGIAASGGYLLLEGTAFSYRGLSIRTTQNVDGTTSTYGNLTTYESGFAAGQTFTLTSANLGYAAQSFTITNVTNTFIGANPPTPAYVVEFGDAYLSLQQAGGGVLTKQGTAASIQAGVQMPAGSLGHASVTADQGTFTALTDLTGLTLTANLLAGRRYKVSGFARGQSSVASDVIGLHLNDVTAAADVDFSYAPTPTTANTASGLMVAATVVPGAGVRTYKLQMERAVGTGNITMKAIAGGAAWLLVEDIGT